MRQPPTVGQKLFRLRVRNTHMHAGKNESLQAVEVKLVGRKYFTVVNDTDVGFLNETKHFLEDWKQENKGYSPDFVLYRSEQEHADELEFKQLCDMLGDVFRHGSNTKNISLNNLRIIKQVVESSNPSMRLISEIGPEVTAYLKGLIPGEKVVETGSSCMTGIQGEVYLSKDGGGTCVRWNTSPVMGTSVTHGTRRLCDIPKGFKVRQEVTPMS